MFIVRYVYDVSSVQGINAVCLSLTISTTGRNPNDGNCQRQGDDDVYCTLRVESANMASRYFDFFNSSNCQLHCYSLLAGKSHLVLIIPNWTELEDYVHLTLA